MSLFHSSAFRNPFPGKYFLDVDLLSSLLSYSLLPHYLRPDFLTIFSSSPNSFLFSSKLYFLSQSWTVVGEISFQRGDKQQSWAEHLPLRPRASTSLLQECKGGSYIFPPRSFFLFPFSGLEHQLGFSISSPWEIWRRRRKRMSRAIFILRWLLVLCRVSSFKYKVSRLFSVKPGERSMPLLAQATISFSMVNISNWCYRLLSLR